MLGGKQHLIAGNVSHCIGIPRATGAAATMISNRGRDIYAGAARQRAAEAEVDIFEIGFERFVQQTNLVEQFTPKDRSGHGSDTNFSRLVPTSRIKFTEPAAACARAARDLIECTIERSGVIGAQNFAGRKPG